jgi:hypothetical protein
MKILIITFIYLIISYQTDTISPFILPKRFHAVDSKFFSLNTNFNAEYFVNKLKSSTSSFTNENKLSKIVIDEIDFYFNTFNIKSLVDIFKEINQMDMQKDHTIEHMQLESIFTFLREVEGQYQTYNHVHFLYHCINIIHTNKEYITIFLHLKYISFYTIRYL